MSAPYADEVSTQYPYRPPRMNGGVLRDVAALALLLAGLVGLVTVGFIYDWKVGVALLSVMAIAAGGFLGYQR